jgi:alpha-tubulin suppressor-like RCC1 family protein
LTAGFFHTCGLTNSGTAYCWGDDNSGQLGDSSTSDKLSPVAVRAGFRFASITAGSGHTCGLTSNGAAYCWGDNTWGQLGVGDTAPRLTPAPVGGSHTFLSLWAGTAAHTCGLTTTSAAYCWGGNGWGQLGVGDTIRRVAPALVAGGLTFGTLSLGDIHTCGLTNAGAGYCWGDDMVGELGDGSSGIIRKVPAGMLAGLAFAALRAGFSYTCGLTGDGAAYCWGNNANGQLGDSSTTDRLAPTAVVKP